MELQETPGSQQCTVAPAEGDKTIDGDIPCEGLSFPEDHTQPQLREVSLGDNQPGAQDPTSSSLGEETSQEPPRSQQTTTGKPSTRLKNLDTASTTIK